MCLEPPQKWEQRCIRHRSTVNICNFISILLYTYIVYLYIFILSYIYICIVNRDPSSKKGQLKHFGVVTIFWVVPSSQDASGK